MRPKFGTDGVRGLANAELTPELVLALGRAAARVLGGPRFLIGRDTRVSGPLLAAALMAGMAAEGIDVVDLGVLPTPGVAALAAADGVPAAVISASHNPFADNGIKLFAAGGRKLDHDLEARLEAELETALGKGPAPAGAESAMPIVRVFSTLSSRRAQTRTSTPLIFSRTASAREPPSKPGPKIAMDE